MDGFLRDYVAFFFLYFFINFTITGYHHPNAAPLIHKIHLPFSATAIILLLATLLSCNKTCQTGYENPNCSVQIRAQFENLYYTVTESKNQDSAYTYSATIIASPASILYVQLSNVGNGAIINNVTGVTNADTLTIPYQAPDSNAHYIQGSGIISGSTLVLNYTITYPDSLPVLHTQVDYYQSQWIHP